MKPAVALVLTLCLIQTAPALSQREASRRLTRVDGRPKLVVLISIDQMRGDYIDRFRHQWTKGLHRLITEGAWFRQADYPYYNTVTCAGHASISTGTVPAVHGMVLNQW
jgi:predicted AlkP superfamily pyrophosphatase or phosphodiesterase